MMVENLREFISERAENLAIVHLTRRSDLSIQRMRSDQGLDFFVEILEQQKPTGQVFGVELKARETLSQTELPALLLNNKNLKYAQTLPFPVCVFLFEMEGDRGFYTWLKSPLSEKEAWGPETWKSLNSEALDEIITLVIDWYNQKKRVGA